MISHWTGERQRARERERDRLFRQNCQLDPLITSWLAGENGKVLTLAREMGEKKIERPKKKW